MSTNYVGDQYMVTEECCKCHMTFGMTQAFKKQKMKNREGFYCPAGHGQVYTGKSEEQKLKDKLWRAEQDLSAESGRAALLKGQRDEVTSTYNKMRDRVKNGVCPCCTRTFQNLLEHMKTKHPEFGRHQTLKVLRDTYGLTQSALGKEIGLSAASISKYEREMNIGDWPTRQIEDWVTDNA